MKYFVVHACRPHDQLHGNKLRTWKSTYYPRPQGMHITLCWLHSLRIDAGVDAGLQCLKRVLIGPDWSWSVLVSPDRHVTLDMLPKVSKTSRQLFGPILLISLISPDNLFVKERGFEKKLKKQVLKKNILKKKCFEKKVFWKKVYF